MKSTILQVGLFFILALDELKIQHRQQQDETKQLQDQLKATGEGLFTLLCNLTNVDKRLCMTYLECDTKEMAWKMVWKSKQPTHTC